MAELPADAFLVWRSMCAILRADHISPLGVVIPSVWQSTPYKKAGKATEDGRDLACQGIAFVVPDGAALLLETDSNIAQAIHLLFPLLGSWEPPFEETLDWIQFAYTKYRIGSYVEPASTFLVPYAVLEGYPLFLEI